MSRRFKQLAIVFVVAVAAAQLIRPQRTNPPTEASRTIRAHEGKAVGLVSVLDRACRDCHSNETVWPWYTRVAPVSWLMAYGVTKGRKAVNFSEWGAYSAEQRRVLLIASCNDVTRATMPAASALLHPEMRLSAQDVGTTCPAARTVDTRAVAVSQ